MNTEFTNPNPFEQRLQNQRGALLTQLDAKFPGFLNLLTSGLDLVTQKHSIDSPKPYHNAVHTLFVLQNAIDVYSVSQIQPGLAHERLTDIHDLALVLVAIAFHDSVIEGGSDFGHNEDESARLVTQKLQSIEAFTGEDINVITELILSTKTKLTEQGISRTYNCNPEDERIQIMRKYIQDVDLANLGNDGFFKATKDLAEEWNKRDFFPEYIEDQINILRNFRYNTQTAHYLFPFIEWNLVMLLEFVNSFATEERTYDNFVEYFKL